MVGVQPAYCGRGLGAALNLTILCHFIREALAAPASAQTPPAM